MNIRRMLKIMRRLFQSSDSLKFTAIALVFMLFLKVIIIDGIGRDAPYVESPNKQTNEVRLQDNELVADNFDLSPKRARTFEDVLADEAGMEDLATYFPRLAEEVSAIKDAIYTLAEQERAIDAAPSRDNNALPVIDFNKNFSQ